MTVILPVLYTAENAVATITLNRPEVLNAFDETVIEELSKAYKKACKDETVRVVVLRGAGGSFCAGGDLNWMRRSASFTRTENVMDAERLGDLLKTINTMPKLTVALVHGHAFGGGVGFTACCDVAIAEEGTQFCLSEVRVGLIPSIIAPYVLNAMGERQARRWFMTAEKFDAVEARRIGLVHEVAPKGKLDATAEKIIVALLAGAPQAQLRGKKLVMDISGKRIDDALIKLTVEQIADARASEEGREGLTAFLDKREPKWKNK